MLQLGGNHAVFRILTFCSYSVLVVYCDLLPSTLYSSSAAISEQTNYKACVVIQNSKILWIWIQVLVNQLILFAFKRTISGLKIKYYK